MLKDITTSLQKAAPDVGEMPESELLADGVKEPSAEPPFVQASGKPRWFCRLAVWIPKKGPHLFL